MDICHDSSMPPHWGTSMTNVKTAQLLEFNPRIKRDNTTSAEILELTASTTHRLDNPATHNNLSAELRGMQSIIILNKPSIEMNGVNAEPLQYGASGARQYVQIWVVLVVILHEH